MLPLWVALAAGAGAVTRYVVDQLVARRLGAQFPWGTLVVNTSGSFLLGLVAGGLSGSASDSSRRLAGSRPSHALPAQRARRQSLCAQHRAPASGSATIQRPQVCSRPSLAALFASRRCTTATRGACP